jgi:class 3 adenylate cyclase
MELSMTDIDDAISQLEHAISGIDSQRAVLGDQVVDIALGPLLMQVQELRKSLPRNEALPSRDNAAIKFEGERKQVTIMFADISGFTAMSEKADPEHVRRIMNACFDSLVPAIRDFGGTVDKFIGDEIMALFGAPVAHENDPERALRVALELLKRLSEFNRQNNVDLGLHFGINTGTVIAGGIGSQAQQQYSVMGDAVNIASRLEDASDRGQIFVGPDTYRLTAPLFDFEELAPLRLKGKSEPVKVYLLKSVKVQPGRQRGLAGTESPMVGRDQELDALIRAADALQQGRGRLVTVIGEPGLGKSRLIQEWKATLERLGRSGHFTWIYGHCVSYGQSLAYHLLIDMLYSIIGIPVGSSEEDVRNGLGKLTEELFGPESSEIYPYLAHLMSLTLHGVAEDKIKEQDPQALQAQYLESIRRLLGALSSRRPIVIVLDDVHWADPSSTDLFSKLQSLTQHAANLFCMVIRPDQDVPGWKLITTARSIAADDVVEINLHPLGDTDARRLASNLLEIDALPERLKTTILEKAEGNPFFVEEVIRMLIDRGAIVKQHGRLAVGEALDTIEIPDSLQGLLLARIDRLDEDVKRTLRVASVIGRQFSVRVLEQVLSQ